MKLLIVMLLMLWQSAFAQTEAQRWKAHSRAVSITRDNFGVPHVSGKTDADAVFGLLYAQCEDDFARVEENYLEKLGRLSELKGSSHVYSDLQSRLMLDSAEAVKDYEEAAPWLRKLLVAFADGINYYLSKHPGKARVLHRFEPWYPLLWTDGSIGASSTGGITTREFISFYNTPASNRVVQVSESNGFAFSPAITRNKRAILFINPHVTFYFRPEVHVKSREGLNAYGAVTWGQFFVYQGFNEFCGWMHTSSDVDVADAYALEVKNINGSYYYYYDKEWLPFKEREILINYKDGKDLKSRTFKTWASHHGPVMGARNGKWLALKANNRMMNGLIQSFKRTKAGSYEEYLATMELKGNPSNNTVYADRDGNIAYWHGNFIPKRDTSIDWTGSVDGSTSTTMWQGLHSTGESISLKNPHNGWLQNCNSTPFTAAGNFSPDSTKYPFYMSPEGDNFRGAHAVNLLKDMTDVDLHKSWMMAYDRAIPVLKVTMPLLVSALNNEIDPVLREASDILKNWDMQANTNSVAQTIAIEWLDRLTPLINSVPKKNKRDGYYEKALRLGEYASASQLTEPLKDAIDFLRTKHGTWQMPWGRVNRFQRTPGKFNDSLPYYAVPFVSSVYGMLPSFISTRPQGNVNRYGYHGNSFVCAVEFGKKVRAISLLAGGQSGDLSSPHYFDQGKMYAEGRFKKVLFYEKDIRKNAKRKYRP